MRAHQCIYCSYLCRQGKRVDTSIDVGISYVVSSVSSSSRKRRQAAAQENPPAKTTDEAIETAEEPTAAPTEPPTTVASATAAEESGREEKAAFAISLLDKTESTTAVGQTGEFTIFSAPKFVVHFVSRFLKNFSFFYGVIF